MCILLEDMPSLFLSVPTAKTLQEEWSVYLIYLAPTDLQCAAVSIHSAGFYFYDDGTTQSTSEA